MTLWMYEIITGYSQHCERTMTSPLDTCEFMKPSLRQPCLWVWTHEVTPRHLLASHMCEQETHVFVNLQDHPRTIMTLWTYDTWLWSYDITPGHWIFCELIDHPRIFVNIWGHRCQLLRITRKTYGFFGIWRSYGRRTNSVIRVVII